MFTCARRCRSLPAGLAFVVALLMTRPLGAAPPDPPDLEKFWGPDKTAHFFVSAAVAGAGYGVTTAFARERWKAFAIGGGAALLVGALKEGFDGLGHGDPSWKDFTWDVMGAAAGLAVAFVIDIAVHGGKTPPIASRGAGDLRAGAVFPLSFQF